MIILQVAMAILVAGSAAYCVLILAAAWQYARVPQRPERDIPPVSILKPLYGRDEGLEENLRSHFDQEYGEFEILFGVHRADDPAVEVAEKLRTEFGARVSSRVVVTGESPIPNAKAHTLEKLVAEAKHELLVMTDSDVRVPRSYLRGLAGEFADTRAGLVTCPYRAIAGRSVWSRLEATGMNVEFLGGVLVSRMLEGMRYALGPAMAVRRSVLEEMGGFAFLKEFLAEDFVMGQRAAELGHEVMLSGRPVEHRIGSQGMVKNLEHRLRWARSTRRSRPAGYWGQAFTYPIPLALLLWLAQPKWWWVFVGMAILRIVAAWVTARLGLGSGLSAEEWLLLLPQDLLGFLVWIGGFWGRKIVWRDRVCTLGRDGRLLIDS